MHHRFFPKDNRFNYKSAYISFPIAKINLLKNVLFAINKFNLFSFYDKDHGDKDKDINSWIGKILQDHNINNVKDIILIAHPRLLGYAFNPVSFWLCLDDKNQPVALLSEVNNTFGQSHCYICFNNNLTPIKDDQWISAKKEFHVSPFMEISGEYKFKIKNIKNGIIFYINYFDNNEIKLSTFLKCNFYKFSALNLLITFVKMPFFTIKTIFLIHYQALKLYFKSVKNYKLPEKLKRNITVGKNEK